MSGYVRSQFYMVRPCWATEQQFQSTVWPTHHVQLNFWRYVSHITWEKVNYSNRKLNSFFFCSIHSQSMKSWLALRRKLTLRKSSLLLKFWAMLDTLEAWSHWWSSCLALVQQILNCHTEFTLKLFWPWETWQRRCPERWEYITSSTLETPTCRRLINSLILYIRSKTLQWNFSQIRQPMLSSAWRLLLCCLKPSCPWVW